MQLFRSILDVVAPHVGLVTEANVPHEEIITYFGKGSNEAQMVYNFALPPLVLLSFEESNCEALSRWAEKLENPSDTATYLNFLDSHDGIGLLPKCEYSSISSLRSALPSTALRKACREPTPGFPAHEKTSFLTHPAAIIWS